MRVLKSYVEYMHVKKYALKKQAFKVISKFIILNKDIIIIINIFLFEIFVIIKHLFC